MSDRISNPSEKIELMDADSRHHLSMKSIAELEDHLRNSIQMQCIAIYDRDVFQRVANPSVAVEPLDYDQISAVLSRIQNPRDLALEIDTTRVWMIAAESPKTQADLGPIVSRIAKVRLTQLFRALLALKAERKW
jgi:hypothetical protein